MQISVQIELNWNWPTGTELGKNYVVKEILVCGSKCTSQLHANCKVLALQVSIKQALADLR